MSTSDSASRRAEARATPSAIPVPARPIVTIAALYGAGGSVIGPRVAERLGVAFLDRAIPASVAERIGVSEEVVAGYDQQPGRMSQLIRNLARVSLPSDSGAPLERLELEEREMRGEFEDFMAEASQQGGVVLGRGANVVLREVPGVLTVLLVGPREARVQRGMEIENVDRQTAERRLDANDEARKDYVRRNYGIDGLDPTHYHLVMDSCAFDLDTCIDLILAASQARMRHATAST